MKKKLAVFSFCLLMLMFALSGCTVSSDVSVMDIEKETDGNITRSAMYWSGVTEHNLKVEEDNKEIKIGFDMEEGSVTFIIENSNGEEVYSVAREGECSEVLSFTAEESGTYRIIEKGKKFKGSYEITWGEEKER